MRFLRQRTASKTFRGGGIIWPLRPALSLAGFTAIRLPPVLKTASGANQGADGYGPFDDYDIGSRSQKGSLATRYRSREQLQRCVAILRANGLDVYLDMVEHQRVGDVTPFVFRYPGAARSRAHPTPMTPRRGFCRSSGSTAYRLPDLEKLEDAELLDTSNSQGATPLYT
jgi:hypothetical protein